MFTTVYDRDQHIVRIQIYRRSQPAFHVKYSSLTEFRHVYLFDVWNRNKKPDRKQTWLRLKLKLKNPSRTAQSFNRRWFKECKSQANKISFTQLCIFASFSKKTLNKVERLTEMCFPRRRPRSCNCWPDILKNTLNLNGSTYIKLCVSRRGGHKCLVYTCLKKRYF